MIRESNVYAECSRFWRYCLWSQITNEMVTSRVCITGHMITRTFVVMAELSELAIRDFESNLRDIAAIIISIERLQYIIGSAMLKQIWVISIL